MDRKYIVQNDVVDRYVRGELPPDEEREFEEFYLTDEWAQQELTLTVGLKRGLPAGTDDETTPGRVIQLPITSRRPPPQTATTPAWAMAAGLMAAAVMAGGTGYWAGRSIDSGDPGLLMPLKNLQRIELIETRSAPRTASFDIRADAPLLLQVETGYAGDSRLTIELRGDTGRTLYQRLDGMTVDDYGRIVAVLPHVDPGSYRLAMLEEESGKPVASFDFEIR